MSLTVPRHLDLPMLPYYFQLEYQNLLEMII